MKYLLILSLFLTGCTSKTEFGNCIGIGDDKKPDLIYKVSSSNIIIGILLMELIAPPIVVLADEFYCPIAKKSCSLNSCEK